MDIELTILGCGSSSGTPAIGCDCPTCASPDPKNRRTRASALLRGVLAPVNLCLIYLLAVMAVAFSQIERSKTSPQRLTGA